MYKILVRDVKLIWEGFMCLSPFGWEEFSHTYTITIEKGALGNQSHLLK